MLCTPAYNLKTKAEHQVSKPSLLESVILLDHHKLDIFLKRKKQGRVLKRVPVSYFFA